MIIKKTHLRVVNGKSKVKIVSCLKVFPFPAFLLYVIFFLGCQPKGSAEKVYYISSSLGDSSFDGLSAVTPFRSFENLKAHTFNPGDKILFKRGDSFDHVYLEERGNGTADNPIILGAYGDPDLPKPVLDAKGRKAKALYIINMSHCLAISV